MEQSILKTTKKLLNIPPDVVDFDVDVVTHINAAFSVLDQLGVGPNGGVGGAFAIDDDPVWTWADFGVPATQDQLVRQYIPLRVRLSFDPPVTSFALDALKEQIHELESRLSFQRDYDKAEGVTP